MLPRKHRKGLRTMNRSFSVPFSTLIRPLSMLEIHRFDWNHPQCVCMRLSPILHPGSFRAKIRILDEGLRDVTADGDSPFMSSLISTSKPTSHEEEDELVASRRRGAMCEVGGTFTHLRSKAEEPSVDPRDLTL